MVSVNIGADIGKKRDPTAVVVAQPEWRQRNGRKECHWIVRHLERIPLGRSYTSINDRLEEVYRNVMSLPPTPIYHEVPGGRIKVREERVEVGYYFIDATGVGEQSADELLNRGVPVMKVYFNHGDRRTVDQGASVRMGKAWLVAHLQALLRSERLHLPKDTVAHLLAEELLNYEIHVDENAHARYGAFRVGTHDDLVTAVGLATQQEPFQLFIGTA